MSPEGYLVELERRHHDLEKELREECRRPRLNDLLLVELKRKKLRIKDEIARVRNAQSLTRDLPIAAE